MTFFKVLSHFVVCHIIHIIPTLLNDFCYQWHSAESHCNLLWCYVLFSAAPVAHASPFLAQQMQVLITLEL